jgi:hypothetical protein
VAARQHELLPIGYVHVVFTMPEVLARLALVNKRIVYDLLFRATAATLLQVAANPKRLGAVIGGLIVLHSKTSPHPVGSVSTDLKPSSKDAMDQRPGYTPK